MSTAHSFAIYWGSMPDPSDSASTLSFETSAEVEAYFQGLSEADGFMEANFVASPRYYVNKDDDFVERAGKAAAKDTERYVLWGEDPEPGTRAQTFAFDTPEEAAAFEQGVTDMVGWTTHFLVPSEEFKACPDLQAVRAFLVPEVWKAFEVHLAEQGGGGDDLVFVRADGAFVDSEWTLDQDISNVPAAPASPKPRKPRP